MQAAMSDARRRMWGAINMIRQVQSPFELANIEPGPPT